jgi:serine/threonine protein kinase
MACRGSKRVVLIFLYCRLILFAEMYCIHYLGVEHGDFEPQNVLRKRWSCSLKIIDFGFSDVDHTCPGWWECGELEEVWHNLQLDRMNSWFGLDRRLFLLSMIVFPLLAFVIISANWRLWPQMH